MSYFQKVYTLARTYKYAKLAGTEQADRGTVRHHRDCYIRRMTLERSVVALFLLTFFGGISHGQQLNFESQREEVISLDGFWRFHTGDDPRWANPSFDDRDWSLLRAGKGWGSQGYRGYYGVGWYRVAVENVSNQPLAILLAPVTDSYQVFANGQMIGGMGQLPPKPASYGHHPAVFAIAAKQPFRTLVIAIRVWKDPASPFPYRGGLGQGGSLLGQADIVEGRYRSKLVETLWFRVVSLGVNFLTTLAGLTALSLFFIGRAESEYLWYALAQLTLAALNWFDTYTLATPFPEHFEGFVVLPLGGMEIVFELLFYFRFFQASRGWLFWGALLGRTVDLLWVALFSFGAVSPISYLVTNVVTELLFISCVTWVAWQSVRRGLLDARLLFWPLLTNNLVGLIVVTNYYVMSLGVHIPGPIARLNSGFDWGAVHLYAPDIASLLVLLATLAILIGRFTRTNREEEQHARELEAARTLQHLLIPNETPSIPGFSILSVYQPAQEVGGDFFQVIPLKEGFLLAFGDVSGKGLPAAMTVSLIVGALRTLAEQTHSPSAILDGLNRRLIGHSSGFTTCLIALLDSAGRATLANAGHLCPYLNGEELDIISNLPLGLSADTLYLESPLALQSDDRFTFVSDGVVEARNDKGELFGFDRTCLNSTQTPDAIASAARQFGQEDDMTILTVKYHALATSSHSV